MAAPPALEPRQSRPTVSAGGEGPPQTHRETGGPLKVSCRLAFAALIEACKQYGKETLTYLSFLEEERIFENADSTAMRSCLTRITAISEV